MSKWLRLLSRARVQLLCACALAVVVQTCAQRAFAQYTPVSASHIQDGSGNLLTNGTLCFQPVNPATGSAIFFNVDGTDGLALPENTGCGNIASGVLASGTQVADSNLTHPQNVAYILVFTDSTSGNSFSVGPTQISCTMTPTPSNCSSGTWSLDGYIPSATALGLTFTGGLPAGCSSSGSGNITCSTFTGTASNATLAATASALASTPTLCPTGQAPTGILPNGNATGCASITTGGGLPSGCSSSGTGTISCSATITAAAFVVSGASSGSYIKADGTGYGTPGGGSMVYPGAGVAVSTGSAWQTSLTAPASALVGVSDTQTLTNKSINASEVNSGTLPHAQLPALVSGDIPNNAANTSGTAAGLSGTPALPNGTTAPTQSALDNSTKIGTTAYADGAVAVEKTRAQTAEATLVPQSTTVNGQALTGNIYVSTTTPIYGAGSTIRAIKYSDSTGNVKGYDIYPDSTITDYGSTSTVGTFNWAFSALATQNTAGFVRCADGYYPHSTSLLIDMDEITFEGINHAPYWDKWNALYPTLSNPGQPGGCQIQTTAAIPTITIGNTSANMHGDARHKGISIGYIYFYGENTATYAITDLTLAQDDDDVKVYDNMFMGYQTYAIYEQWDSNWIERNNFQSNNGGCVYEPTGLWSHIISNICFDNGGWGVRIDGGAEMFIQGNAFGNPTGAVNINGGTGQVTGNNFGSWGITNSAPLTNNWIVTDNIWNDGMWPETKVSTNTNSVYLLNFNAPDLTSGHYVSSCIGGGSTNQQNATALCQYFNYNASGTANNWEWKWYAQNSNMKLYGNGDFSFGGSAGGDADMGVALGVPGSEIVMGTATVSQSASSDLTVTPLATPVISAVTMGTTGGTLPASTSECYIVVAYDAAGNHSAPSSQVCNTTSAGTSNTAMPTWSAITGAQSYKVYGRTTGAELLMTTLTYAYSSTGQPIPTSYTDTGSVTPSGAIPTGNTSGNATVSNLQSAGTAPTLSGCSYSAQVGAGFAGAFTSGTTGTCAVTITFATAAAHAYRCQALDETTTADVFAQTAHSSTSCTISATTASGDYVNFQATGY